MDINAMNFEIKDKIENEEDLESAMRRLEYYRNEYKWLTKDGENSASKSKEVYDEARKIIPMINGEKSEEQLYYTKYYNILMVKKALIDSGEYASKLKNNIISVFYKIKRFNLNTKDYSIISFYKALFKGDNKLKEDLKLNRTLLRAYGDGIPNEENLSIQSPKSIIGYIDKYYELVGIELPKESQNELLPAISNGYLTQHQKDIIEMVDAYISTGNIGDFEADKALNENEKRNEMREENNSQVSTQEVEGLNAQSEFNKIVDDVVKANDNINNISNRSGSSGKNDRDQHGNDRSKISKDNRKQEERGNE